MAAQDLPTGEKTCRLEVSWRLNFMHNTMMKGMIESGARQGIKETYETYCEVKLCDFCFSSKLRKVSFSLLYCFFIVA
jgi:hypothetical protein